MTGVGFEALRRTEKDGSVKHGEIGIGELRGAVAELRKQRTAFGFETVETPIGQARDVADGAIVLPHQRLGRSRAAEGRYFILAFEAEFVVVAAGEIVEIATNLEEHGDAFGEILIARAQLGEPAEHLEIAQAAG